MERQKLLMILESMLLYNNGYSMNQIIKLGIPEDIVKEGVQIMETLENG